MTDDVFEKVVRHCREHCEHASDRDCWLAYLTGYYAQALYNPQTYTRVIPAGGSMGSGNEDDVSGIFNFRDCIDTGYWPCLRMISFVQVVDIESPPVSVDFFAGLIDPRVFAIANRPPCSEIILFDTVEAGTIDIGGGQTLLQWSTRCKRIIPKQSGRFWELLIQTITNIPPTTSDACVTVLWDEVPAVPRIPRCGSGNCV